MRDAEAGTCAWCGRSLSPPRERDGVCPTCVGWELAVVDTVWTLAVAVAKAIRSQGDLPNG